MNEPSLIKKDKFQISDSAIKKQKRLLIISVISVVFLFIGSSYALLTNFDDTNTVMTVTTGKLTMAINSDQSLITLAGRIPEREASGLANSQAVPIILTNTNPVVLAKYVVKLVADSDPEKVSTLDPSHIRYVVSTDGGNTYGNSRLLSENDVLYTGYILPSNGSKTIYIKMWVDENAGTESLNKTFYGSITVDLYQEGYDISDASYKLKKVINDKETKDSCITYVEDTDGTIYMSGSNTGACAVDYNYVWYSGKMWRITAIYPDGRLKMITEDIITSIDGYENSTYEGSWLYQWLNEDFLNTLYDPNKTIIDRENSYWNSSDSVPVYGVVGSLNEYEYQQSYKNTSHASYEDGYLNIKFTWYLIDNNYVLNSGNCDPISSNLVGISVRPSIYLSSNAILQGNGTINSPYRIEGDIPIANSNATLLNTRISGEYVIFKNELYRIVEIEENTTKIVRVDYLRNSENTVLKKIVASTRYFGSNSNTQTDKYWDYYLNNIWLKEIFEIDANDVNPELTYDGLLTTGKYYLGKSSINGQTMSYKAAICSDVDNENYVKPINGENACERITDTYIGYVGLLRVGEMFSTQSQLGSGGNSATDMYLITPIGGAYGVVAKISQTGSRGYGHYGSSGDSLAVRPTLNIKSDVVILGGDGTINNPFIIE